MKLTDENCNEIINAFTETNWKPLIDLIPTIEETSTFGEWEAGKRIGSNVSTMPYWNNSEIVNKFVKIAYDIPIVIDFDWMSWEEGAKMINDESFDFDVCDMPTKCQLITAMIRSDRFCDGALVGYFKSGQVLKILESIEEEITVQ